jgi:hypothetical protein
LQINLSGTNSGLEIDNTGLKIKSGTFNPKLTLVEVPSGTSRYDLTLSTDKATLTFLKPPVLTVISNTIVEEALAIPNSIILYFPITNILQFTDRNALTVFETGQVCGLIVTATGPIYAGIDVLWKAVFGVGIGSIGGDLLNGLATAVGNIGDAVDREGQSGNINVDKIPKNKPLANVDGKLTLKYNNNHLVLNEEFDALQLHRAFGNLIGWSENDVNNSIGATTRILIDADSISDVFGQQMKIIPRCQYRIASH